MDVKVVSPLWIEQCRQAKKKVSEDDFNANPSVFHEHSAETSSFITAVQSISGTASSGTSISSKSNNSVGPNSSSNSSKTGVQSTTSGSSKSLNLGKSVENASSKGGSISGSKSAGKGK